MSNWRRSPRPLGAALDGVRGRLAPDTPLGDIQSCWSEAVGAVIAAQATPTSDRGGVVTVACSASVWAQELDLMGPEIVRRLNELIGSDYVRGLRCVATGAER